VRGVGAESRRMRGSEYKDEGQREDDIKPGLLLANDTLVFGKN
jgi:hypothetical protein